MTGWGKKSASLHTVGRKLGDGATYIVDLEDMCPAGVLIEAYNRETSDRYTLSVSEREVRGDPKATHVPERMIPMYE